MILDSPSREQGMQRMFSRHACECMVAYHSLGNHKDEETNNLDEKKDGAQRNPLMTAYLIKL
jgi:hypothetical protein